MANYSPYLAVYTVNLALIPAFIAMHLVLFQAFPVRIYILAFRSDRSIK